MKYFVLSIFLVASCASSTRGNHDYCIRPTNEIGTYTTDHHIGMEITDNDTLIIHDGDNEISYKMDKISDRVYCFKRDGLSYFVSVFDSNCFKPRRLRNLIFSLENISPYSRHNHVNVDLVNKSDYLIVNKLL